MFSFLRDNRCVWGLGLIFLSLVNSAQADDVLDWNTLPQGTPAMPIVTASHSVDISVTDPNSALLAPPGVGDFYGANGTDYEYVVAGFLPSMVPDFPITIDMDISGDPSLVSFELYDVDGNERPSYLRHEQYTITATYQGSPVAAIFTTTSQMEVSGDTVDGVIEVAPADGGAGGVNPVEGVLGVSFEGPVDHIQITFAIELFVQATPSSPGYAIGNIHFRDVPQERAAEPVPALPLGGVIVMALSLVALGRRFSPA